LCRRAEVFVGEMIYGIQASESAVLAAIGRTLHEDVALIQTEEG